MSMSTIIKSKAIFKNKASPVMRAFRSPKAVCKANQVKRVLDCRSLRNGQKGQDKQQKSFWMFEEFAKKSSGNDMLNTTQNSFVTQTTQDYSFIANDQAPAIVN